MNRLVMRSRVGADGVLQVQVPLSVDDANREVEVTIEAVRSATPAGEEYSAWLHSIAGQWQGDFERPPQGDLEERDALS